MVDFGPFFRLFGPPASKIAKSRSPLRARPGSAGYRKFRIFFAKNPDFSVETIPQTLKFNILMIFENSKFFQNLSKIPLFFDFLGPPALKIAKSAPLTLGRAPKALRQTASGRVENFFPQFYSEIRPKLHSGPPNFEFWSNFEIFIFWPPDVPCQTPPL